MEKTDIFIKVFHSKNKKWTFYFCPFFESYPRSFLIILLLLLVYNYMFG